MAYRPVLIQVRPVRLAPALAGLVYRFQPKFLYFAYFFSPVMKSLYGSLLLLSIIKVITAGPLPTRPVVDVRMGHNRADIDDSRQTSSTGRVWQILSGSSTSSMDYLPDVDFKSDSDSNENLDVVSSDLTPHSTVIQSRRMAARAVEDATSPMKKTVVKRKKKKEETNPNKPSPAGPAPGAGLEKAGKIMGDVSKVTGEVGAEVEGIPIVGEILGTALEVVTSFLSILSKVFNIVGEMEKKSAQQRGEFTKKTVEAFVKAHPGWNVVVTDDKHEFYGEGVEGKDWSHQNTATHTVLGKFKYDVYGVHSGIFILEGDGGFQNWAYMTGPQVKAVGYGNHRLIFSGPTSATAAPTGPVRIHLIEYTPNADGKNQNIDIVAIVFVGGMVIGFSGDGNLGAPISIDNLLHKTITVTASGKSKDTPLSIKYDNKNILTSDKACKMTGYNKHGMKQGDCTITA